VFCFLLALIDSLGRKFDEDQVKKETHIVETKPIPVPKKEPERAPAPVAEPQPEPVVEPVEVDHCS
jgi:hypothetical protein